MAQVKKYDEVGGYKVLHVQPKLSEEEKEAKKQEIAKKIYQLFSKPKKVM